MEHVNLNPYSVMNVRLATQILSSSVSSVLYNYYPESMHGTAALCSFCDKFFDCLNVRNQLEGVYDRKEFMLPYRDVNDSRFTWLKDTFLQYLENWKLSILNRPGDFTKTDRDRMFLPQQTYDGIRITIHSFIELTQFLLRNGMPYVLSERLCLPKYSSRTS